MPPALVEQPVVGDRQHPGPKLLLAAAEPRQVADHLQEDLSKKVIGIACPAPSEVATHSGRVIAVDRVPGPLLAQPRRHQCAGEALSKVHVGPDVFAARPATRPSWSFALEQ